MKSLLLVTYLCICIASSVSFASDQLIGRKQAAKIAKQHQAGRILKIKRKKQYYRVKTLTPEGDIRVMRINARSGKIRSENKKSKK